MRFFLFFLFSLNFIILSGQEYRPFISGTKCWLTYAKDDFTMPPQEDIFHDFLSLTEGDTVTFNGITYHNLWASNNAWETNFDELRGLIREDTLERKVWYVDISGFYDIACLNDTTEILLYDFSAELGDTVAFCQEEFYKVDNIVSLEEYYLPNNGVIYDTFPPAFMTFTSGCFQLGYDFIYEGIGSNHGILPYSLNSSEYYFIPYLKRFSADPTKCSLSFVDSTNDIDLVKWSVHPNPFSDYLQIQSKDIPIDASVELYSLSGQLVSSTIFSNVIDVTKLEAGYYLLTLRDSNGFSLGTKAVVKMR